MWLRKSEKNKPMSGSVPPATDANNLGIWTPEQVKEMERMNPKSRDEIEEELEEEAFLKGGGDAPEEPQKTEQPPRHRHQ